MHRRRYSPCCKQEPEILPQIMTHSVCCSCHYCWLLLSGLCLTADEVVSPICALEGVLLLAYQTSERLLLAQVAALEQQAIELRKQGSRFGLPNPSDLLSSLGLDRGFSRTSSAANLDLEAQKKDLSRLSYGRSASFQGTGERVLTARLQIPGVLVLQRPFLYQLEANSSHETLLSTTLVLAGRSPGSANCLEKRQ